jgi:hypothetical protein
MGGLKTFLCALATPALLAGAPLPAAALPPEIRLFADCAGRLSALREDQWMFDGPASDRTSAELAVFAGLIEVGAPADRVAALNRRVAARAAFRGLLAQARFGPDPRHAARANRRAAALLAECRALMLG